MGLLVLVGFSGVDKTNRVISVIRVLRVIRVIISDLLDDDQVPAEKHHTHDPELRRHRHIDARTHAQAHAHALT